MRASSTTSVGQAVLAVDQSLGKKLAADLGLQVATEFSAWAQLTKDSPRLARALSDPARSSEQKEVLVEKLAGNNSPALRSALNAFTKGRWSSEKDISDSLNMLATHVLLKAAFDEGRLETVTKELFAITQLLAGNRQLRSALTDSALAGPDSRIGIITKILDQKVDALTLRLVQDAVKQSKAGRLQSNLRSICDAAAAMRDRSLATVISAVELTEEQLERIKTALSKTRGTQMVINTIVDPTLVGGLRIRFGDEIVDGSVSNQIKETKRQLLR